jgi:hypothetical protein
MEDAEVGLPITVKLEIGIEAGLVKHAIGIAADVEHSVSLDRVVGIQTESMLTAGNPSAIDHSLPVVLTGRFQARQLE